MRRTAQHPRLAVTLVAAALAATVGGALAGCQSGAADAGTSSSSSSAPAASSSSSAPAPSSSSSAPSAEPTASATTSAGPNVLTAPEEGATVSGRDVTITGEGTAFEGTLLWRVVSQGTGDAVQEGFTTAGANGTVGPFSVAVTLDPGVYTVEVWEPSQKDGAADSRLNLVSVTFTVVA